MPRSAGIALLVSAALIAGVFPSAMFGDDGELTRAVWEINSAHPPGFPAYLLLAKPLTLLPFGSIALRVHLASILACAAAAVLVALLAIRWGAGIHGAWLAAAVFAFSPIVSQQARLARTYPFLAAATAVAMLLADRLVQDSRRDRRLAPLLLFTAALGLGIHQLMAVPLAAGLALTVFRRGTGALPGLVLLPLGSVPFLALPLRAAAEKAQLGWGRPGTLEGLTAHLLQKEYAGKVTGGAESFLALLRTMVGSLAHEMTLPAAILAAAGVYLLARRRRTSAILLAVVVGGTVVLRATYSGAGETGPDSYRVIVRYLLGSFALLSAAAGIGWNGVLRLAGEGAPGVRRSPATLLTVLALIALSLRPLAARATETPWLWHDRARGTLLSAPAKGIVLVGGDDILFPIWYLQGPGGYAPDRLAVSVEGFGRLWYREEVGEEAARVFGVPTDSFSRPAEAGTLVAAASALGIPVAAAMIPPGAAPRQSPELAVPSGLWSAHGLVYRLAPSGATGFRDEGEPWRLLGIREPRIAAAPESLVPLSQTAWFLTVAARAAVERGRPAEALPLLFRAAALDPSDPVIHNDTGLALMALDLRGPAAEAFREALRLRPEDPVFARNLRVALAPVPGGRADKEAIR